jgi:hypothetical protein
MENTNKAIQISVHLDHLGDAARQVREAQRQVRQAQRDIGRAQREAARSQREATRQVRDAARQLREAARGIKNSPFGELPDLSSWVEAARALQDSTYYPSSGDDNEKQVTEQSQTSPVGTPEVTTHSQGFFGRKTKETIEGKIVTMIEGVLTLKPGRDALSDHNKYLKALTSAGKQRYEESLQQFRKKAPLFLRLIGSKMVVPDEALAIWVSAPAKDSLARTSFDTAGRAFISIDLDDIESHDSGLLTYFHLHEFFHLISRYQTYSLTGAEDGLEFEKTVFKLGLETTVTTTFKVRNIRRKDWDEWASKLLEIKKALEKKNSYSYSASTSVIAMIKLCKAKFGKSWLDDSIAVLKEKGDDLYQIQTWVAEIKDVEGTNINETLVDCLGRIASCQNPLEPTDAEIQHLRSAGTYGNLKGINRLIKLYRSLNQVQKIELLTVMLHTLKTGNAESLVKVLSQDGMQVSLDALMKAKLPGVGEDEGQDALTAVLGDLLKLFGM